VLPGLQGEDYAVPVVGNTLVRVRDYANVCSAEQGRMDNVQDMTVGW
jgi:hypothetical protein